MTLEEQTQLLTLFCKYSQGQSLQSSLLASDVARLMEDVGYPIHQYNLQALMKEWDPANRTSLSHNAFLSIMASYMMKESLEVKVHALFRKLCFALEETPVTPEMAFGVDDVLRVFKSKGLLLTREQAEELVFDASAPGETTVSFDGWWEAITYVDDSELTDREKMANMSSSLSIGDDTLSIESFRNMERKITSPVVDDAGWPSPPRLEKAGTTSSCFSDGQAESLSLPASPLRGATGLSAASETSSALHPDSLPHTSIAVDQEHRELELERESEV
eukprot:m.172547 g.172547  ORF g.172547 m.172547 type:complete len:276 (-) comp17300_c0_seq2:386-1213(-)